MPALDLRSAWEVSKPRSCCVCTVQIAGAPVKEIDADDTLTVTLHTDACSSVAVETSSRQRQAERDRRYVAK